MLNSTTFFPDWRCHRGGLFTLLLWFLGWGSLLAQTQESFFEPVSGARGRLAATARAIPNAKLYKLNEAGLRNALANTARQYERGTAATIALPLPDGTTERFALRETQVLSPALAAANPTIKTYEGEGTVHKGYIIRMSLSSLGFEALIWGVGNDAVYFARTTAEAGGDLYQSYYARDARKVGAVNSPAGDHHCGTIGTTDNMELPGLKKDGKGLRATAGVNQISNGTNVRQFRIAVATTGEWARNAVGYDGTQTPLQIRQGAFPVVVTAVNRINGIYERELACRFQIVNPNIANNQVNIVFDDPVTDPYSNTDTAGELTANQTTLDNRVGTNNYDVGHLFGTRGGGVATSPVLCATGFKARGYSARNGNNGDPFVVDYFAHELGHQFSMDHTYNVKDPDETTCDTRAPAEAYEVASGSTIMSYVGICSEGRNLQQYTDFALPSFHISSITKATAYLASAATDGCGTTAGTNTIPTVSAGNAYTIPRLTPFTLTATGADADAGDVANLSYSWEEYDLAPTNGASGAGGTPSGVYDIDDDGVPRPILRAYSPVKNPQRTFPSTAFILNPQNNTTPGENQPGLFYTGTHPTGFPGATCPTGQTCIIGERLPTIARTMNFRVSVRDLRGGISDAGTVVTVINTPGAFRLTSFDNASAVMGNSQQTVTWNVVATNQAPINCVNVAIKLSTDGGVTFPTTLLASTPNDGSEVVVIPNGVNTSTARLRVEAVGNIFFDISNTNFTITPTEATAPVATANANQVATVGTAFSYTVNAFTGSQPISYSATGVPVGLAFNADTRLINGTPTVSGTSTVTITGTNSAGQAMTMFTITVNPAATAPVATTNADQMATVGTAFSYTVNAFTGSQPITYAAAGLPQGLVFNTDTRLISGTPTTPGTSTVTITGTNSAGQAMTMFTITVSPAATPTGPFTLTGVMTVNCSPIQPNRFSLTFQPRYASDNGSTITFSVSNELFLTTQPGPYTLQLYSDNPRITLNATQSGVSSSFVYNWLAACNSSTAPNTPPRLVMTIPSQTATQGNYFSYVIPDGTFTDTETPGSLQLSAQGVPPGLNFAGATLSGTPSTTVGSPFSIAITATDPGGLSAGTSLVLTVQPATGTPPPTMPFAITGVTTISCTPVANRINLVFTPRYQGMTGQTIAFEVVNELAPTTDPAPYSLTLYRDNPVITLRASQTGSLGPVTFRYDWLVACQTLGQENTPPRLNEPVASQTAVVGQGYSLNLTNTFIDQETPDQIMLTAVNLPAGLMISGKFLSGTPSMSGVSSVTLTATDGGGLSTSTSFSFTVVPAPVTPPPTAAFSITGVTTMSCEVVSAGQRRVTFNPRYAGLDGSPVSFSVVSELLPTINPGPYVLNLYTDNPVITLKAVQGGVNASFSYGWLSACNSGARMGSGEPGTGLQVRVLGNPVSGTQLDVEVRGADGQDLTLSVVDERGYVVTTMNQAVVGSVERFQVRIGKDAGTYYLQAHTPTSAHTLKIVKQ